MAIDTTKIIAEVSVNNVDMQLKAPTGIIDITENGTVDVTNYATANVNVSGGSSTNKFTQLVDKSITEVTADDLAGVTSIGTYVFYKCHSLTTITIPDSVTSIGDDAFQSCSSLTTITIPASVTSIGSRAFDGCTQLTGQSINSEDNVKYLGYTDDNDNFVPTVVYDITTPSALSGEYTIPNTCKVIYSQAFYRCSSLTTITIPDSVTSIGFAAFRSCSSLTTITIPASVTSIGAWAFDRCSSLTSVIYEGQVPDISNGTFDGCSNVQLYDFRNCTTIPSLDNTFTLDHASGCQIVVPDALYEQWQQATNWSSLTDVVWVKSSEYVEG